jgi:SAM-dependent methyltransferase
VLDLGCNAGYWSLAAIEAGADFVFGIDGRQMHLDQANLVFEAKGIDPSRYQFELGNIFEYEFARFDVVLCLGLMYHIAKPVELFEVISGTGAELVLLDTAVSLLPQSAFRVQWEDSLENPRNAVDYEMVLVPTRSAVLDLARQFGYDGVCLAQPISDYTGMRDYRVKSRAVFLCSKGISLQALARERTDPATLGLAAMRRVARRVMRGATRSG